MVPITPLRVVPAKLATRVRLGGRHELISPLPLSSLDDPEQVDAEMGHP